MIDFVKAFTSLIKIGVIQIDNNVFKLHYKFTVVLLIIFSILLTSKQFFGEPIDCDTELPNKAMINTYCWIYGTFIVRVHLKQEILSGVGPYSKPQEPYTQNISLNDQEFISQKYYQWVCLAFCFQALLFYIPRYLWKIWEGGRLRLLVSDLRAPIVTPNEAKRKLLLQYMLNDEYRHESYALKFAFCETLNCLNVFAQIIALDWFLTGNFFNYGPAVAFNEINGMSEVFPRLTKCTYVKFGPSGGVQNHDALCILPLNILNEKLFLVMWIWFFLLAFISLYQVGYRSCVILSSSFRQKLLRKRCKGISEMITHSLARHFTFGDMFFLDLLGRNLNPMIFKQLILDIYTGISQDKPNLEHEITLPV